MAEYNIGMITQILQQKINSCGKSRYELSTRTGLNVAILHRIAHGKNCSAATADRLFTYFDLAVVEVKKDR